MLTDGRPCRDVLVQLSAAMAALERARRELFVVTLRHCDEVAADAPDRREGIERLLRAGRSPRRVSASGSQTVFTGCTQPARTFTSNSEEVALMRTRHLPIVIAATAVVVLLLGVTAVLAPRAQADDPGWSHDQMHAEMRAQMPAEMVAECDAMHAQMGDPRGSMSQMHGQMPRMSGETGGMMGDPPMGHGPMGGHMAPRG
jgi:hypothetical protein